ncbi:hypothetical protein CR105_13475 [Massilia eurypsychrophila]|uniref:Solute-binding protein family 3/N-terminal domain-containing protein n=1 Tax=Massilia eurypsychrophila TaxID=1485217 RepID=A0A2G8TEI6_9BURK|nr:hypothetical protein [Massilia eurypsychrophila]PIL44467.1 hypothetical protein CR105_13475 [Massilia eurypsychrophila]
MLGAVALMAVVPPLLARMPRVVVVTAEDVEDSFIGAWLKLIYTDAYGRLGYEMTLRSYPARRASAMSDSGLVDGEINRYSNYGEMHPQMIRIDPPHFSIGFCAYGRPSVRVGPGWTGLSQFGDPQVDYRNGVARCEEMLATVFPASQISVVNNATLGIRRLAQRRTDLYVDIESVVDRVLKQPEFVRAGIRRLSIVETVDMHCYVHRSKRELVRPVSAVLTAMKKDGSMERHRKAALLAVSQRSLAG